MKTPEEIKKGLAACSADECHGQHAGCTYQDQFFCTMRMCGDALAYIQQLETSYSQVSKALCGKENATLEELLQEVSQVKSRLAQVERERDAAVHDLPIGIDCNTCKYSERAYEEQPCSGCKEYRGPWYTLHWEWRGVCAENTKEET